MSSMIRTTTSKSGYCIGNRIPFNTNGGLRAQNIVTSNALYYGQLPSEHAVELHKSIERTTPGHPVFVVFSYQTPIAWWSETDGWTVPDVRYSTTTIKHQNIVRRSI